MLLLMLMPFFCHAGTLVTSDGKTLEGGIALVEGGLSVGGKTVPLANIRRAILQPRPQPKIVTAAHALPDGWKSQDIGKVKLAGSAVCDAQGVFTLTASGWGAWGPRDSFHFAYQALEGDGQIIAHVAKLGDEQGPTVAGIMFRESLAPDAPMAIAELRPKGDVRLGRRPMGSNPDFRHPEALAPQAWLRLTRRGEVLRAYRSVDGREWTLVDSAKVPMSEKALVGVACWTTGNSWLGQASIDSVKIIAGTPGASYFENGARMLEGIVMRDGNVRAGQIVSADASSVKYKRGEEVIVVPVEKVAQVVFNPAPADLAVYNGKKGVATANGDFIEGDITDISLQNTNWPNKAVKVTVRSVLFGTRTFEASKDVIAAVMGDVVPAAGVEVHTSDGSIYRAAKVEIGPGGITADGETLADVVEIRR